MALALNTVMDRIALAKSFGQKAYGGDRDYYDVLGYPKTLSIEDYMSRYGRQDIATRVVDLPAQDTWKKPPLITEDGRDDTPFVKAWQTLVERKRVFSVLSRLDRISGIGRYGVLYLGFRDGQDAPSEPVKAGSLSRVEDLLFLRPFSEQAVSIKETEEDHKDQRFGLPTLYHLSVEGSTKIPVHWSRILHVADNKLDSDVYGVPRLQVVFNRLDDIIKIVGGSAEGTWLNMRPGTLLTTQEGYEFKQDDDTRRKIEQEIAEYLHGLARVMTIEGVDVKTMLGQVLDPRGPFDVQIALISAASGIPQRVLLGSAAGQLAAAQEDMRQWYGVISYRQTNYAEPDVLRPFIDRMVEVGVLPEPTSGSYDVGEQDDDGNWAWPPLGEQTDQEKAQVSMTKAQTAKALQDPLSLELPLTWEERRALLGLPSMTEPIREEVPAMEPELEPETVASAILTNLRTGAIDRATYLGWLEAVGEANAV